MLAGVNENAMSIWLAIIICAIVISFMPGRKMIRGTVGRAWKPVLAAHQSGRTSQMRLLHVLRDELVWARADRPALRRVVVREAARILALPDVLGDDRHADVGAEREEVPVEARRRPGQIDLHRLSSTAVAARDQAVDLGPVGQVRVALEQVEGEGDVLGRKRHAVAPLGARANVAPSAGCSRRCTGSPSPARG